VKLPALPKFTIVVAPDETKVTVLGTEKKFAVFSVSNSLFSILYSLQKLS
jgi:hypothetical protein